MKLSLVVPVYNEIQLLDELMQRSLASLQLITNDFEILLVDDGSTDDTLSKLLQYRQQDKRVKILELSKNFGHQIALTAGLENAQGEYVVMMDGDLQDPPELIPALYKKICNEHLDVVNAHRKSRGEGLIRRVLTGMFHSLFRLSARIDKPGSFGNFSIMNREALTAILSMKERLRYLPGLRQHIGFHQGKVDYERGARRMGESKMKPGQLIALAIDAIFSFSRMPILLCLIIGVTGTLLSIIWAIYAFIQGEVPFYIGLYFIGSVQLVFIAILGEYIYRIYQESQRRPIYFIRKKHTDAPEI